MLPSQSPPLYLTSLPLPTLLPAAIKVVPISKAAGPFP